MIKAVDAIVEAMKAEMRQQILTCSDEKLAEIHVFCIDELAAVEAELARRKQEQPKEEGGFAA